MKKKIKNAVLILLIIIELIWLIYCADGVSLFIDDMKSELFRFTSAAAIHAILMLIITISGIVRMRKKENFSIVKNILMLPIATIIWFGTASFFLFDIKDDWIAGILFIALGVILTGLMHIHLPKKKKISYKPYTFTHIKAEWSEETVQQEYCRINGIEEENLTDRDRERIVRYSSNWLLYFIKWLVKHDFYIYDEESEYEVIGIAEDKVNPSGLFEYTDNCLSMENIKPELEFFMTQYFEYSHSEISRYIDDYLTVVHRQWNIDYCLEYSEDLYEPIEKLIDLAYMKYCMQNESDELRIRDQFYCEWNKEWEIQVITTPDVSAEYFERCCNHFNSFSDEMKKQLCEKIREHMFTDEIENDDDLIPRSNFDTMTIYKPYGDKTVYIIGGEPDYEMEHGMAFVVCDDSVLDIGYRYDIEGSSPWISLSDKSI